MSFVQMSPDIELSGADCTTAFKPRFLVQSPFENDSAIVASCLRSRKLSRTAVAQSARLPKSLDYLGTLLECYWKLDWD